MRASRAKSRDSGFTLVEVLASLVIFSVAILALTRGVTNGLRVSGDIETRTLASIVAENQLARAASDPQFLTATTPRRDGESTQLDQEFDWTATREPTASPSLSEVIIEVSQDDQLLISRRTFVGDLLTPPPAIPAPPTEEPDNG